MKTEMDLRKITSSASEFVTYLEYCFTTKEKIRFSLIALYDAASDMQEDYNNPGNFLSARSRTRKNEIADFVKNIFDIISPQDHLVQESGLKAFVLLADFIQEGRWNSTSANTNVLKIFLKRMLESLDTLDEVNGFLSRAQADVKKIALERRLVLEQRYEEIFMQRMHSFKRKVDNQEKENIRTPSLFDETLPHQLSISSQDSAPKENKIAENVTKGDEIQEESLDTLETSEVVPTCLLDLSHESSPLLLNGFDALKKSQPSLSEEIETKTVLETSALWPQDEEKDSHSDDALNQSLKNLDDKPSKGEKEHRVLQMIGSTPEKKVAFVPPLISEPKIIVQKTDNSVEKSKVLKKEKSTPTPMLHQYKECTSHESSFWGWAALLGIAAVGVVAFATIRAKND